MDTQHGPLETHAHGTLFRGDERAFGATWLPLKHVISSPSSSEALSVASQPADWKDYLSSSLLSWVPFAPSQGPNSPEPWSRDLSSSAVCPSVPPSPGLQHPGASCTRSLSCDPQAASLQDSLTECTVVFSHTHTPCHRHGPGPTATSGQGAANHVQMKWSY
ncbi:Spermidine/Spermine N(1)-Acetyltransferase-Like Protein 1 [Manis pentadactyla]|nr:Spermidine/Spermine N(1)-Acetyltransferase-Like Protein 1 [Manis pentadactyla]